MTGEALSEFVWDGYGLGEIRYESCPVCGTVHSYPRGFCTNCGNVEMEWKRAERRGVVYSAATVLRAPSPAFAELAPYDVYLLNLAEGPRLMAHGEAGLGPGDEVQIDFEQVAGTVLPYLRRLRADAPASTTPAGSAP